MHAADVLEILAALDSSRVRAWVVGGWGVDALLAEQTREHADLDLLLDLTEEELAQAALEELGFRWIRNKRTDFIPDALMPKRIFMRDDSGRMVDLHGVDLRTWPGSWFEKLQREARLSLAIDPADAFAEGRIAGRRMPCLSPGLQVASCQAYELSEDDRRDMSRLCAHFDLPLPAYLEAPISAERIDAVARIGQELSAILRSLLAGRRSLDSTLIMPVPSAASALAIALGGKAPDNSGDLPPHITVLYPFVPARAVNPALEAAVVDVLAGVKPFPFRLARVASFPGVLYLEPNPVEPFIELTDAFSVRWPELPPYGGEFDEVVPHLTVCIGEVPSGLVAKLERLLPIESTAREVWLLTQGVGHRWKIRKRFHLGP